MEGIQKIIDDSLLKEQVDRATRQRSGKISPSQLGRCYRYQFWYRKGEKPSNPPDARTLRVFRCGHLFHDFVQKFIPDQETEVKCDKNDIFGYADIVTKEAVIDIKSQHSYGFHYMKDKVYDIAKEKYTNWLQVACYAQILGKATVSLLFVSKDDLCVMQYAMPTKKWIPEVEKELAIIRANWVKNELPKAEARAYGGKECKYCSYFDKCGEIGDRPALPEKRAKKVAKNAK